MCRPPRREDDPSPLRVVIAGAGPAGLLLAALLLQRNAENSTSTTKRYNVTLIDNREDLSQVSPEEMQKAHRSWMLALASHGIVALQEAKGLFEEYCRPVGVKLESFSMHLGAKEIKFQGTKDEEIPESFVVDRNFVVAAIARYVDDRAQGRSSEFQAMYEHKIMYVDYDGKRVLARENNSGEEEYLEYDLLVGCDGARSVVREALIKRDPTFAMDIGDIFQTFKQLHLQLPKAVDPASMHLLPDCFPSMTGIGLPETSGMLNVGIGVPRHLFGTDKMASELLSDNPQVVAEYAKKAFKAFELVDYEEFGRQWVNQRWNRTAQVHCNCYHSTELSIVIMGDAAHATSPSIGMGMNQALKDAQALYHALEDAKDNLNEALPAFSTARVKEGNSLTDLAMHLYCIDTKHQLIETIHMVVRGVLHKWFPSIIDNHAQAFIGLTEYSLSDVYRLATQQGIIKKHRVINDRIRQDFFERECGMMLPKHPSSWLWNAAVIGSLAVATGAVAVSRWK